MRSEPRLQERLWENANRLYQALDEMGLDLGPMVSPVVAVTLDVREKALACWQKLLESGVYVNLVVPPASPTGNSLLRCSVSAAHSPEEIDALIEAFGSLRDILG